MAAVSPVQDDFASGAVRALVALHAEELSSFLETWRAAEAQGLALPATEDPSYASREHLLVHVLACAAGYLVWICEQLEATPPDLDRSPPPEGFGAAAGTHMEKTLAAWDVSLRELTEAQIDGPAYNSRWGVPYCIDSMLEHAVMHPMRHRHQLEHLMGAT